LIHAGTLIQCDAGTMSEWHEGGVIALGRRTALPPLPLAGGGQDKGGRSDTI
jgi:hypothetical protein